MTDQEVIIGIDTSNYTTSVAILGVDGQLIANIKRPLPVKEGKRGLRQSEAVFSHIKNIPSAMEEAKKHLPGKRIVAVGVSERPRNVDGSYMPCFLAGVASAESISCTVGAPLFRFSHQCGHIMAALYSSNADIKDGETFCAFHVSGGTTECLRVVRDEYGFRAEQVGGTLDLNAGQIIDRIGVKMGLKFPAGPELERLALSYGQKVSYRRPHISDTYVNLSGLENMAEKMLKDTGDQGETAMFVLNYIADSLIGITDSFVSKYGEMPLVFAGGVMCNSIIRKRISDKYGAYFAEPNLSADNAVGIAALAREEHLK